jgi:ParB family chromosome partitioning protein
MRTGQQTVFAENTGGNQHELLVSPVTSTPKCIMAKKASKLDVLNISLSEIAEPELDMRSQNAGQSINDLIESMGSIGLINPILVRPTADGYEVIAGARRMRAAGQLNWKTIPAIVYPGKGMDAELAKMAENQIREAVSPIDEAEFLQGLATAYKLTGKQLATKINRAESYVSERLALLRAPIELRRAVADGQLSFSSARELSRIKNEAVRQTYISHAITTGINDATAKQWRLDANAAEKQGTEAPDPQSSPQKDNVQAIKVQCALTGKTVRIENSVLVRICKTAWEEILASMSEPA